MTNAQITEAIRAITASPENYRRKSLTTLDRGRICDCGSSTRMTTIIDRGVLVEVCSACDAEEISTIENVEMGLV